jgi:hypothetical protein
MTSWPTFETVTSPFKAGASITTAQFSYTFLSLSCQSMEELVHGCPRIRNLYC